jgi:hypothetical protein
MTRELPKRQDAHRGVTRARGSPIPRTQPPAHRGPRIEGGRKAPTRIRKFFSGWTL